MSKNSDEHKSLQTALEDHSPEGLAILSSEPSVLIKLTVYLLSSVLLAALVWSFFGKADVMVTVSGKLGPETHERRIYAAIDGQLVDLYIAEGMPVSKGDVLARLNARGAISMGEIVFRRA